MESINNKVSQVYKNACWERYPSNSLIGEYGGIIETNNPGTWWKLNLEVDSVEG